MSAQRQANDLSDAEKNEIAEGLNGTSGVYDATFCEKFKITPEVLEQVLEEKEIERCESCGWWCEASEMEEGNCEDCRE